MGWKMIPTKHMVESAKLGMEKLELRGGKSQDPPPSVSKYLIHFVYAWGM